MINFKPSTMRTWSIIGSRGAFGVAFSEIAKVNENILGLSADLCTTSGLDRFRKAFPERFFNTGIAEQNMIGVASGLSSLGFIPFASTFSNFSTLRSCEHMRHFLGYMKENVKVVGLGAGFAMGMFGVTHYGIEDIAAVRAISNLTILSPADCTEVVKMTELAASHEGAVYLRLTGVMNHPMVYKKDYKLEIGKAITLSEGDDIGIIATGSMVFQALEAEKQLKKIRITSTVINMHTIKPLDTKAIETLLDYKLIVTVEEHSIIGGLGSAVAEHLSGFKNKPPQLIIGVEQGYPFAGEYHYLIEKCGLTGLQIADKIIKKFEEVK